MQLRGISHHGFGSTILQPQFLWAMGWKEQIADIKSLGFNAVRVPFGSLVERGLVPPGTELFDRARRVCAVVAADGTLTSGPHRGSIHRVGAAVQDAVG